MIVRFSPYVHLFVEIAFNSFGPESVKFSPDFRFNLQERLGFIVSLRGPILLRLL